MILSLLLNTCFATELPGRDLESIREIGTISKQCFLTDKEDGIKEYSLIGSVLGPLNAFFLQREPSTLMFENALCRFFNGLSSNYVRILDGASDDRTLSHQKIVDAFLNGKILLPVPKTADSDPDAHGGMIGRGRLPFFVHDLFHTQEIITRVMPYQESLSILFNKILENAGGNKAKAYFVLSVFVHEIGMAPKENIFRGETIAQEIANKFFQHLKDRFASEFAPRSIQNDNFYKELALCSWIYQIAAQNVLAVKGVFSWDEFTKQVKSLAHEQALASSINIQEKSSRVFAVVHGSLVPVLSRSDRTGLMLAELLRDLKKLEAVPEELSLTDEAVYEKISTAIEGLIRDVQRISLNFSEEDKVNLLRITGVQHEEDQRSLIPIEECYLVLREDSRLHCSQLPGDFANLYENFFRSINAQQRSVVSQTNEPKNVTLARQLTPEQLNAGQNVLT